MWALRDRLLVDIVRQTQDKRSDVQKLKELQCQMDERRRFIWRPKTDRNIEFFTKVCSTIYRSLDEIPYMAHIEPEWNPDVLALHQNFLQFQQNYENYRKNEQAAHTNFIFNSVYKLNEESEVTLNYLKHVLPQHVIRLRRAVKERRSEQCQDSWSALKYMHLCLSKIRSTQKVEVPFVKQIEKLAEKLLARLRNILHGEFEFATKDGDLNEQTFLKFDLLFYGLQSFMVTEFALMELRARLAESFLQQGYVTKCNEFMADLDFTTLKMLFSKRELDEKLNWDNHFSLFVEKFREIIKRIQQIPKVQNDVELGKLMKQRCESLATMAALIETANATLLDSCPLGAIKSVDFENSSIQTPLGLWQTVTQVSYAVQFKSEGNVSRIGLWSKPLLVEQQACPVLKLRHAEQSQTRLVYRKFDAKSPKLVGILQNPLQTEFHDISRELYDLAKNYDHAQLDADLQQLLKAGADLNAAFENGRTLLHAAAQFSNEQLLKHMLQSELPFDINAKDDRGYTALHIATAQGHTKFALSLLKLKSAVNAQTKKDRLTALHLAACKGKPKLLKVLMTADNCDVNIKDKAGFTALHYATTSGRVGMVARLSSNPKIDLNAQSNAGLTALHIAVLNNDMEMTKFLLKQPKIDVNIPTNINFAALNFAFMASNLKLYKLLLSHSEIDVNLRTCSNFSVLHYCIILNKIEFFEELLKIKSLNVSANAVRDITPLQLSIVLDLSNFVIALLKAGCELDTQTITEGFCALHVAIRFHRPALLLLVIAHGPKLELKTAKEKRTPLAMATPPSKLYDLECLRYLIQNGADFYYFCR